MKPPGGRPDSWGQSWFKIHRRGSNRLSLNTGSQRLRKRARSNKLLQWHRHGLFMVPHLLASHWHDTRHMIELTEPEHVLGPVWPGRMDRERTKATGLKGFPRRTCVPFCVSREDSQEVRASCMPAEKIIMQAFIQYTLSEKKHIPVQVRNASAVYNQISTWVRSCQSIMVWNNVQILFKTRANMSAILS